MFWKRKDNNSVLKELQEVQKEIDLLESSKNKLNHIELPDGLKNRDISDFIVQVLDGRADIKEIRNFINFTMSGYKINCCTEEEIFDLCNNIANQFYNVAKNGKLELEIEDKLSELYEKEKQLKENLGIR